jgi:hypothetical protein
MEFKELNNTGIKISVIRMGTWIKETMSAMEILVEEKIVKFSCYSKSRKLKAFSRKCSSF